MIDESSQIDASTRIGPLCGVGRDSRVGANCQLVGSVHIGNDVQIGDDFSDWDYFDYNEVAGGATNRRRLAHLLLRDHQEIRCEVISSRQRPHRQTETRHGCISPGSGGFLL